MAATVFSRESADGRGDEHIGVERLCLVTGVLHVVAFLLGVVELRLYILGDESRRPTMLIVFTRPTTCAMIVSSFFAATLRSSDAGFSNQLHSAKDHGGTASRAAPSKLSKDLTSLEYSVIFLAKSSTSAANSAATALQLSLSSVKKADEAISAARCPSETPTHSRRDVALSSRRS